MDTITHAISGAVVGAATALPGRERDAGSLAKRALWGALFAAFPDSDILLVFFLSHFDYLLLHRGVTHSIILMPAWAVALGFLGAKVSGLRWREMAILAALALVAHICGDLITSFGTRIFAPFWNAPLAFPITFIIDPIFTAILLVGVAVAIWKKSALPAQVSGLVLLAYLALQATMNVQATEFGERYAAEQGIAKPLVVVFPQPLSPFNWKVIVVDGDRYLRSYVNVLTDERIEASDDDGWIRRVRSAYRPLDDAYWQVYPRWPGDSLTRDLAVSAWQQPAISGFREFALLPYVSEVSGTSLEVCVWFTDLRFTLPERRHSFEYAMCRHDPGGWSLRMEREERD